MDSYLLIAGVGLAAGAVHVVAGPDHLAAVAPMAAHEPKRATKLGFQWGLGHGIGAAALGVAGIVLRDLVSLEAISAWSEFLVGFMLIGIGMWALRAATKITIHAHQHHHDGDTHQHIHVHTEEHSHDNDAGSSDIAHSHSHAPLYIGALHGAAGTGHLLAVLPSLALPPLQAAIYLCCYFVAAICAMGMFGMFLGLLGRGGKPENIRRLMYASASAAIGIGVMWVTTTLPF